MAATWLIQDNVSGVGRPLAWKGTEVSGRNMGTMRKLTEEKKIELSVTGKIEHAAEDRGTIWHC